MPPIKTALADAPIDTAKRASAQILTLTALAASLSACGGGGSSEPGAPSGSSPVIGGSPVALPPNYPVAYSTAANAYEASRFLLQAGLSANDADIASVQAQGFKAWLTTQIGTGMPVASSSWQWLKNNGYDAINDLNYFDQYYPADFAIWNQLIFSSDGVRKRAALALSELFVVSLNGSLDFDWRSFAIAHYWDTLCVGAFGNWRDLLEAVSLHPVMGVYLSSRGSKKENPATGQLPDENYAREVMQLFTIGLVELNMDGTPKIQSGSTVETYTSADVSNLAKVFTGYDFDKTGNTVTVFTNSTATSTRNVNSTAYTTLRMAQTKGSTNFSFSDKSFLGAAIPGSATPSAALKIALDALFNHANTAPFFAKQMIQRLITSNPSPAYVQRVAQVFAANASGVRGDMASVFAAILLDDEARSPAGLADPQFGKIREPMLRFAQWARTFKAKSTAGTLKISDLSDPGYRLGQSPMRSPSVFNYYRPGYAPPNTSLTAGSVAPEMQIVNETTVAGFLNFIKTAIAGTSTSGIPSASGLSDLQPDYSSELLSVQDPAALIARVNTLLCAGQLSTATAASFAAELSTSFPITPTSTTAQKTNRVCAAVLMAMAHPEYTVQK